ncbi:hypothetical protein [Haloplanus halobius]|uniref:hypothetical protein n=1 Tax=Haloplanus halobius TaxID=2934938 RepID=UPI00200F12B8|nr:hypothetical protein [Haloplanus sp. XH21]
MSVAGASETPIDGQVFMLSAAKASVGPSTLSSVLRQVQADLGDRLDTYRQEFERVAATDEREVFLVPTDHWATVGDRLGLSRRERDAVARTHAQQLRRIGSETDRREEFETALEIREAAVIGRETPTRD